MKTISIGVITALLAAGGLYSQTAKVVPLSQADVDRVKAAYEAKQKADADWQAMQTEIEHKYVSYSREEIDYGTSGAFAISGTGSSSTVLAWDGSALRMVSTEPDPCEHSRKWDVPPDALCLAYEKVQAEREAKRKADREEADRKEQERLKALPRKTVYFLKPGWQNGFEFSDGFQFIVPRPEPPSTPSKYPSLMLDNAVGTGQIQWNGPATLGGISDWKASLK